MVISINDNPSAQKSQLFILRVWLEEVGNEQMDWRAKIQHVESNEVRYFRNWSSLEAFVEGLLRIAEQKITERDTTRDNDTKDKSL